MGEILDKLKGKAKQVEGRITGDGAREAQGDHAVGAALDAVLERVLDEVLDHRAEDLALARNFRVSLEVELEVRLLRRRLVAEGGEHVIDDRGDVGAHALRLRSAHAGEA